MNKIEMTPVNSDIKSRYDTCIGCGVCLLSCPVWRQTRDVMLTVCGRMRSLQTGGSLEDMRDSLNACVLCGACGTVCPAGLDTVGLTTELRAQLAVKTGSPRPERAASDKASRETFAGKKIFFPGMAARKDGQIFQRVTRLLERDNIFPSEDDDISDIAADMDAGSGPPPERLENLISSMSGVAEFITAEGFLHRYLKAWFPKIPVAGLGEALLRRPEILKALTPDDLYVIEPRGYHADHKRLVKFYDRVRLQTGCTMSTSLQRAAIPVGATEPQKRRGSSRIDSAEQVRWILDRRKAGRVVLESIEDMEIFKKLSSVNVLHVSELQ
ncbi:MAG: 4Fe-4S dicluster domain-containing protein [Elusimicrobia bacterium]|nr:4Fe-4S dicluster domain-containing protein [Elusimicrobiota bacterium]